MAWQHLVRVGALSRIGRFTAVDFVRFPRGARVIVRTGRGLEIGQVLAPPSDAEPATRDGDGSILRGMTLEDELLAARLEQNQAAAFAACQERLAGTGGDQVLIDVEQLFDGQSLWFYFLGEVSPQVEALTAELAEVYESKVQIGRFAAVLAEGCGPTCGTESAQGGGCSTCSTHCGLSAACAAQR